MHPLLHPSDPAPPTKTSLPYIGILLNFFLATPLYLTYHWSLLFPACRPSRAYAILVPLYNLFRAVDTITRKFGVYRVSVDACLCLPFSALIEHRLPPFHSLALVFRPPSAVLERCPGVLELTGNDVLTFDPEIQALQACSLVRGLPHPTNNHRAIQFLQSQQLLLTNFIHFNMMSLVPRPTIHNVDIAPITNYSKSISHVSTLLLSLLASSFSFESHSFLLSSPSTKGHKSLPLLTNFSSYFSLLGAVKWKQFRALQIPLNARNIWFRILHAKLQFVNSFIHCSRTNSLLTVLMAALCRPPQPQSSKISNASSLLVLLNWKSGATRTHTLYLLPRFSQFTYEEYLVITQFRLDIYRSTHELFPDLSMFQVFACNQQAIWFAHYRQVFHHSPFMSSILIYSIHCTLTNLDSQLNLDTVL